MIKKWLFPFPAANGKEITDPNAFYAALAGSEDGFFPIGANGLWHGGVHFGAGTSGALKQDDGIRCIADGEVVAYRLDARYPEVQYPSGGGKAAYSTGFVLVRHKLVLPPPPSPPGNASSEAATPPPADDVLVFFSLYMHLLDKAGYDAAPHLKRPQYWGGPAATYAVGAKAKDKEPTLAPGKTGLRIRNAAHEAAGLLPTGAVVKLGAASPKRPAFNELASVVSGAEGGKVPDSTPIGYVFKAELDAIPEPDAAAVGAVYVLPTPIPVAAGALMGHMGNYQNFDDVYPIPARGPRPLVHLEVFTGADLPAFLARSRARAALLDPKQRNRLLIDVGAQVYEPIPATGSIPDGMQISPSSDSPKSGRWAKAKLLVPTIVPRSGLGAYQASTKTYQYQGQRVTFTGRFVGAADSQVTTNEAEAKRLGYARREVMLPSGDAFWVQRSDLGSKAGVRQKWDKFPLQLSQPGPSTINTSRVLTKADLEKIPVIDRALDANGRQWWKLNRVGWICERDQAKVAWKSPWDWAGFELVEETSRPADLMARDVHHLGGATGAEAPNFKQRADNVDGGPLLSKVRQAIDKQGVVDGVLTRQEFRRALSLPWLADRIGRLIVRYESEWGGDMGKWDELDALMMEGKADWRVEKGRIRKLSFWRELARLHDLPNSPNVFFFHPVALVGNFLDADNCRCGCCVGKVFSRVRYNSQYGPMYSGTISLASSNRWDGLISSGRVTSDERDILVAMSENEGNLDAIQSYDSEIITAGAMQKTVNPSGYGEFPIQVDKFRRDHPDLYVSLFEECGWEVRIEDEKKRMYYAGVTGVELKRLVRDGFDASSESGPKESKLLASILKAIRHEKFIDRQIVDFIDRLRLALTIQPDGYEQSIGDFVKSKLGKALVLDHHVNRPGYVSDDFASALDDYFSRHTRISRDPTGWGVSHESIEKEILAIYGPMRRMTDARLRFNNLKGRL